MARRSLSCDQAADLGVARVTAMGFLLYISQWQGGVIRSLSRPCGYSE